MKHRAAYAGLVILSAVIIYWILERKPSGLEPALIPPPPESASPSGQREGTAARSFVVVGEDPIAGRVGAGLNAVDGTARRDLAILQSVFAAWRTNAPGQGNPVGTNQEITAALTGQNRWGFVIIPPDHPAINARGELCDRWGSPLFFHQLSGERMEIRSLGPDRTRGTDDDIIVVP